MYVRWLVGILFVGTAGLSSAGADNVGLDAFFGFQLDGNRVAFRVSESRQGATDLNGDGDALDFVLHVYDAVADATVNVGLDAAGDFQLDGNRVAFSVSEFRHRAGTR